MQQRKERDYGQTVEYYDLPRRSARSRAQAQRKTSWKRHVAIIVGTFILSFACFFGLCLLIDAILNQSVWFAAGIDAGISLLDTSIITVLAAQKGGYPTGWPFFIEVEEVVYEPFPWITWHEKQQSARQSASTSQSNGAVRATARYSSSNRSNAS